MDPCDSFYAINADLRDFKYNILVFVCLLFVS